MFGQSASCPGARGLVEGFRQLDGLGEHRGGDIRVHGGPGLVDGKERRKRRSSRDPGGAWVGDVEVLACGAGGYCGKQWVPKTSPFGEGDLDLSFK